MILGVDVGGTNIDVVVYDPDKNIFHHVETKKTSEILPDFLEYLHRLAIENTARAIGIGAAVWLREREPVFAPNLPDLKQLECLERLRSEDIKIVIENDANCFALFAATSLGVRNLLGITVGTGVGGGIIFDGKIYRGMGMAGEIGHTVVTKNGRVCGCGKKGHLEAYFGGRAFFYEGKDPENITRNGTIYTTEGFEYFCASIANAIRILDPEVVALGGRIGMNLDVEIVDKCVQKYLPEYYNTEIVTIKDEFAVAKGACLVCKEVGGCDKSS
jgi:glucokinase/N-acetylglucosamine kinase